MLTDLQVRNFAIAEDLALEFNGGLTVLTGETGAGKSILIGALGLVLGDRADSASVRRGASNAQISASFDIGGLPEVGRWLEQHDLAADGECHLRRVVGSAGRSRAYVNGHSVALQAMKDLGATLMDIHGQHEHQALLRPRAQRDLIDGFGGHTTALATVHQTFDQWYRLDQQYRALRAAHSDRDERLDLMRFQVQELAQLELREDEYQTLAAEQKRIAHLAGLAEGVCMASAALTEGQDAVQDRLSYARRALAPLLEVDPALSDAVTMLDEAQIQIDEASDSLHRYAETLDMDPQERDRIETRLDQITDIARKHRVAPGELMAKFVQLSERLDGLEHADTRLEELAAQRDAAADAYRHGAAALTRKRRAAARKLATGVRRIIHDLGMPDAVFLAQIGEREGRGFARDGLDTVVFSVAVNPGEPARPISRVASGGELSRISLAIQVVTARLARTRCMVFDEVDAGIGGAVAQIVGRQLRDLADSAQVICVTHLAQVASQAGHHLKVSKSASGGKTRSSVMPLTAEQKVEELARMLGGVRITRRTREHAAEMLAQGGAGAPGDPE